MCFLSARTNRWWRSWATQRAAGRNSSYNVDDLREDIEALTVTLGTLDGDELADRKPPRAVETLIADKHSELVQLGDHGD